MIVERSRVLVVGSDGLLNLVYVVGYFGVDFRFVFLGIVIVLGDNFLELFIVDYRVFRVILERKKAG